MTDPATSYLTELRVIDGGLGDRRLGEAGSLNAGGGGDNGDGMSWQEAVRRVDEKVDGNFKWVLGVYGAGFMILLAAFASGYVLLSHQIEDGNTKLLTKLDGLTSSAADIRTDIAVLKATTPAPKKP